LILTGTLTEALQDISDFDDSFCYGAKQPEEEPLALKNKVRQRWSHDTNLLVDPSQRTTTTISASSLTSASSNCMAPRRCESVVDAETLLSCFRSTLLAERTEEISPESRASFIANCNIPNRRASIVMTAEVPNTRSNCQPPCRRDSLASSTPSFFCDPTEEAAVAAPRKNSILQNCKPPNRRASFDISILGNCKPPTRKPSAGCLLGLDDAGEDLEGPPRRVSCDAAIQLPQRQATLSFSSPPPLRMPIRQRSRSGRHVEDTEEDTVEAEASEPPPLTSMMRQTKSDVFDMSQAKSSRRKRVSRKDRIRQSLASSASDGDVTSTSEAATRPTLQSRLSSTKLSNSNLRLLPREGSISRVRSEHFSATTSQTGNLNVEWSSTTTSFGSKRQLIMDGPLGLTICPPRANRSSRFESEDPPLVPSSTPITLARASLSTRAPNPLLMSLTTMNEDEEPAPTVSVERRRTTEDRAGCQASDALFARKNSLQRKDSTQSAQSNRSSTKNQQRKSLMSSSTDTTTSTSSCSCACEKHVRKHSLLFSQVEAMLLEALAVDNPEAFKKASELEEQGHQLCLTLTGSRLQIEAFGSSISSDLNHSEEVVRNQ